ncbi:MAG: AAA family ATPase [Magnetococcus sp. DMHC-6]
MYTEFLGLTHLPFRNTPDTRNFFMGAKRGTILDCLIFAVLNGEGILKVVGEIGTGKTMICRMLVTKLPPHVESVFIANPNLSADNILQAIAMELRLVLPSNPDRLQVMHAIQNHLLRKHAANQRVILLVEEAQNMPLETLEEIRILSNLETNESKLLQIILFGQPELDQKLANPSIRQLKDRISYNFNLEPLNREQIQEYLDFCMSAAGYEGQPLFHPNSIRAIEKYSKGLIRRINLLANKSLMASFVQQKHRVDASHVRLAAKDSEFDQLGQKSKMDLQRLLLYIGIFLSGAGMAWVGYWSIGHFFLGNAGTQAVLTEKKSTQALASSIQPTASQNSTIFEKSFSPSSTGSLISDANNNVDLPVKLSLMAENTAISSSKRSNVVEVGHTEIKVTTFPEKSQALVPWHVVPLSKSIEIVYSEPFNQQKVLTASVHLP